MLAVLTVIITMHVPGLPSDPVTIHRVVPDMSYCRALGDHVMGGDNDTHHYQVACAPLAEDAKQRLWDIY